MTDEIDRLLEVAHDLGYDVDLESAPLGTLGHIDYACRTIWIAPASGIIVFLTLLHELGHAMAADRLGYGVGGDKSTSELLNFSTGEIMAYFCGWAIARHLHLTGPGKLTKELWRLHHAEIC